MEAASKVKVRGLTRHNIQALRQESSVFEERGPEKLFLDAPDPAYEPVQIELTQTTATFHAPANIAAYAVGQVQERIYRQTRRRQGGNYQALHAVVRKLRAIHEAQVLS